MFHRSGMVSRPLKNFTQNFGRSVTYGLGVLGHYPAICVSKVGSPRYSEFSADGEKPHQEPGYYVRGTYGS